MLVSVSVKTLAVLVVAAAAAALPGDRGGPSGGALLVAVREGAGPTMKAGGAELVSARLDVWRVNGDAAPSLLRRLRRDGAVRAVEPEVARVRLGRTVATDPLLPGQWWLAKIGADTLDPPAVGVPVTMIDSGVDAAHPEFAGRPGTSYLNLQTLEGPRSFHGTAVASVLGAPANGVGLVGVYPAVDLRSWDASPGPVLTSASVVAGIEAAAAFGRGVVNLSIGGSSRSGFEAEAVLDAFRRGTIVVAASGNDRLAGSPPSYPASLPHVVSVGATNQGDRVAGFSSASTALDLVAPGEDITAAVPGSFDASGYHTVSGTSFAAPMVAAAAAWIWSARPELEKTQVIELLRRSAVDLSPQGRDVDTGFGLLDLKQALSLRAPAVDPFEPNDGRDDLAPENALTRPGRARATIRARLDVDDDPRDLYTVWIPPRRRILVRSSVPTVRVLLLGRAEPGTRVSAVAGGVALENRSGLGRRAVVNAFMPVGSVPGYTTYKLRVESTRLRPRR